MGARKKKKNKSPFVAGARVTGIDAHGDRVTGIIVSTLDDYWAGVNNDGKVHRCYISQLRLLTEENSGAPK